MGVTFHQYIECVEFDENGELMPYAVNGREWGDFLCAVFDEWVKGDQRKISVRLFDSIMTMMVDGIANVCAMSSTCRQYLVVEHNGDVYPCDFFVDPELKLGNIMENSWEELLASSVYEEFGNRKARWNPLCAKCEYLKYCAGCCPKNRSRGGKHPDQMSILCDGWKKFYHHSLKEFRRLANDILEERESRMKKLRQARSDGGRAFRDAGRNDLCPCGSGIKFKKCCGKTQKA